MDIYITFFAKRKKNTFLHIDNGFSFGREKRDEDVDLFFHYGSTPDFIDGHLKKYGSVDKVFCSLSYPAHLPSVKPLLADNWVIGGPLVARLATEYISLPGVVVRGSFEKYLGKETLDSTFTPYFDKFVARMRMPHLFCNCSIGKGCYWSKCKFCDYRYYDSGGDTVGRLAVRPQVGRIVEQLHPMEGSATANYHLGIPATPPKVLADVLNAKRDKRVWLTMFLRADNRVLQVMRESSDNTICERILFSIGCESLSQYALDTLNKGTTVDNTLELARLILERSGTVVFGIMDHYVFANSQMVKESLESLEQLKDIVAGYPTQQIMFTNNGVTHWPTEEAVSEFTDDYSSVGLGEFKRYVANVPKDSEAFTCNRRISMALVESGITHRGEPFVSLR